MSYNHLKNGIETKGHATQASSMLLLYPFHEHNELSKYSRTSKEKITGLRRLRMSASKRTGCLSENSVRSVVPTLSVQKR